ncbi:MAG: hypothetical protein FWG92_02385 [Leptospirales bacterium]|nr:hypothetical protein [Leptospirales bacterium]
MKKLLSCFLLIFVFACQSDKDAKAIKEAQRLIDSEKYTEAIGYLTRAIEESPKNADLYYERGRAHDGIEGNDSRAIDDFMTCIKINDKHREAYRMLHVTYSFRKEFDLADKYLKKTIENTKGEKEKAMTFSNAGHSFLLFGLGGQRPNKKIIEYLIQAMTLDAKEYESASKYAIIADCYLDMGEREKAKLFLQKALEIDDDVQLGIFSDASRFRFYKFKTEVLEGIETDKPKLIYAM